MDHPRCCRAGSEPTKTGTLDRKQVREQNHGQAGSFSVGASPSVMGEADEQPLGFGIHVAFFGWRCVCWHQLAL